MFNRASADHRRAFTLLEVIVATMIVGMLAILRSGAAYLPLDPELPVERLAFMARREQRSTT